MKNLFLYILAILLILIAIILNLALKNTSRDQRLATLDHIDQKISFFHYKNIDRYINYHLKNKKIPIREVIIHVNMGLDFPYYDNTRPAPKKNTNQVLVNKYYYLGENYVPDNLVEIDEGYSKPGMLLVKEAALSYIQMAKAMASENLKIRIISSYRSYQYQKNLYNRYQQMDGKKNADRYSARPGFSEHQTGLVIDLDNEKTTYEEFGTTQEFTWLMKNAYRYGFILRYPKGKEIITGYTYEPWHFRYVGKKLAKTLKKQQITLDEYEAMTPVN